MSRRIRKFARKHSVSLFAVGYVGGYALSTYLGRKAGVTLAPVVVNALSK